MNPHYTVKTASLRIPIPTSIRIAIIRTRRTHECLISIMAWRQQLETFSALLAIYAGNSSVTGEFTAQRPVILSYHVFLICPWINYWVNNREAGDLRRNRAHYDVTVMAIPVPGNTVFKLKQGHVECTYHSLVFNNTRWNKEQTVCMQFNGTAV